MKVFLGGTCNGSKWRQILIPLLKIDFFNPVVEVWTPECQAREIQERKSCDFCLYVITPSMMGFLSVAEVVDDSHKRPEKTLFVPLRLDGTWEFDTHQWKSMMAIKEMVVENGAQAFNSLIEVAHYLNIEGRKTN